MQLLSSTPGSSRYFDSKAWSLSPSGLQCAKSKASSREILDAGKCRCAHQQPVALATALLLLPFALGAKRQCLHLAVTLQSCRAFWRLLLLTWHYAAH